MEILIDTNFIITCAKERIDLFENLKSIFGVYELIIPIQLFEELNKLSNNHNLKIKERNAIEISIKLLKKRKEKTIDLKNSHLDAGIIGYIKNKKGLVIGTLDKELKNKIKSLNESIKFLTIRQGKYVVLED